MTTYKGSEGIRQLRKKIKDKQQLLMRETITSVTTFIVDASPVGAPMYNSRLGKIENDVGDYKNSWAVGLGKPNLVVRVGDASGGMAISSALSKSLSYNDEDKVYITNNTSHAVNVENGWVARPDLGWKAKSGYNTVALATPTIQLMTQAIALKVSKL